MTASGRCLCGAVSYVVGGPLREILVCHCHECRRWAGTAWAASAARADDLAIAGEVSWRPSPRSLRRADRGCCPSCGSSLFWRVPGAGRVSIGAGTLDEAPELRVAAHIWMEQGAEWERPPAGVPAYARGYPDEASPLAWL